MTDCPQGQRPAAPAVQYHVSARFAILVHIFIHFLHSIIKTMLHMFTTQFLYSRVVYLANNHDTNDH